MYGIKYLIYYLLYYSNIKQPVLCVLFDLIYHLRNMCGEVSCMLTFKYNYSVRIYLQPLFSEMDLLHFNWQYINIGDKMLSES